MRLVIHADDAATLRAGIERGDTLSVIAGERGTKAGNNSPCGSAIQNYRRSRSERPKTPAHASIDECDEPSVEAKLTMLLPDQVDHREIGLAVSPAKAASHLLREDRGAVRRAQEQYSVDAGHVDPFPKYVNREHGA